MKRLTFLVVLLGVVSNAFGVTGPFTKKVAFTTNRDGNFEIYKANENGSVPSRVTNDPANDIQPAFARDGKLAFVSNRTGNDEIFVLSADGLTLTQLTSNPAADTQPAWSPDGTRIAFVSTRNGSLDVFIVNVDGTGLARLTDDPGADFDPVFHPNGSKIFFITSRDGNNEVYSMNLNGTVETRITNNSTFELRPDLSPNGASLVVARMSFTGGGTSQQVVIMTADGSNPTTLTSLGSNSNPAFSADGKKIYFNSSRDGNDELYVMNVDGSSEVRLTFNGASDLSPSIQSVFEGETIGIYRPSTGQWKLDLQTVTGPPQAPMVDIDVTFGGQPGDLPLAGDWNNDGRTDIGVFRGGSFHLAHLKQGPVLLTALEPLTPFNFGQPGDLPVAGDWDGDGKDDVGVFRPATGTFNLRLARTFLGMVIVQVISFNFGTSGDLPVAGDWNGDGVDTVGVFRPGDNGTFLLTNAFTGNADFTFTFGSFDMFPVAGDWLGEGEDGVGVFIPFIPVFTLTQELFAKGGFQVSFGQPGDLPVAGSWVP